MSMALALVLTIGLVPTLPAFALEAPDGMPDTIKLKDAEYAGRKATYYMSPNGLDECWLQHFTMDVDGQEVLGVCYDHAKRLNSSLEGTMVWNYSTNIVAGTETYPFLPFLDYYQYALGISKDLDAQYPEKTGPEKLAMNSYYLDVPARAWVGGWVQSAVWLFVGKVFTDINDQEQLRKVAAERVAASKALGYNDPTVDESLELLNQIIGGWREGKYGKRNYYLYYPEQEWVQPILIPQIEEVVGQSGYIKVLKSGENDDPLSNAVFTIYSDSTCTNPVGSITTGSDGSGYAVVDLSAGLERQDFWVKETTAPGNYKLDTTTYQVTVDANTNNTPETAALVNGGAAIGNVIKKEDPPDSDSNIKKIDAVTKEGVGIAWFHFEGEADDPQYGQDGYISLDYPTDENGNLEIQWTHPEEDNYIPPGQYTVTEKEAPPGYELNPQSQHLVLSLEWDNQSSSWVATSSGPLVFENNPKKIVIIEKVSAEGPLEGAYFDVYRNGQLVTNIGPTGPDGTITYDGDGEGISTGYYEFVETVAPAGYLIPWIHHQGVYVDASDQDNMTYKLTFKNAEYPEILIQKVEAGTENRLAGAIFEVTIDGTNIGRVGPTGADGTIVLDYETYGEFLDPDKPSWTIGVREVVAPDGYLLDDDNWQYAELSRGQTLAPFVFSDTPYPEIHILKRDRDTGDPVPGTSFKVEINGVDIGTFITTGEDGIATITYEDYARFLGDINGDEVSQDGWGVTVTEIEVTPGYNKDLQPESGDFSITKHLQPNQSVLEFVFEDTPYRDLLIRKYDSTNSWLLQGAEFRLESISLDDPATGGTISRNGKTDENGELLFENLPNGTYKLTEVTPPTGYDLPDPHEWEIVVTSYSDRVIEFDVQNHPREGLLITKHDAITNKPLANVEFTVRYLGDGNETTDTSNEARPYMTDENGVIYIEDIVPGWYEIRETRVPDGYVIDPEPRLIEVVNNHGSISVPFFNYQDTQLIILKKDNQTKEPLPGARFVVTTAGGNVINANLVTGANGYATLNGLEPGSYVVREVEAPDGHLIDSTLQTFEIRVGQTEPVFLVFGNDGETTLYIRKEDAQTRLPVADAVFELRKADGEIVERRLVTGPDGLVSIDGLEPGDYIVEEIEAPPGYLLAEDPEQIVNLEAGETETVLFRNNKPGGIV